jgi:TRAP-type transport system periplasmic protein
MPVTTRSRWQSTAKAAVLLLATVLLFSASARAGEKPLVCKLAVIAPRGTGWSDVGDEVKAEIEKRSQGRIQLIWYYGGVMGDEIDEIKKIRHGQLQGGGFTLMGLGNIAPEVKLLEMPMIFDSYEEKDYVLGKMEKTLNGIFREKGFVVLSWLEVGFAQLYSSREIHSLDDLRKTKMWVWGGEKIVSDVFTDLGFRSLIPLQLPDVLQSLQVGMVESFFGPYYTTVALQWHTHARYMTEGTFAYTPAAILVTTRFFDTLPEDLKPAFLDPWKEMMPRLNLLIRKNEREAFEGMKAAGTRVIAFSPEDKKFMLETSEAMWRKSSGTVFPAELLQELLQIREEYRKTTKGNPGAGGSP